MPRLFGLVAVCGALLVSSCDDGPPLPSESLDVTVDLRPGQTVVVEVDALVMVTNDAFIAASVTPTPETLAGPAGGRHRQHHARRDAGGGMEGFDPRRKEPPT
jgi:hypothetical protein